MKKIKIEYLIYLFIILSPILDAIACIFRDIFPNAVVSPSTIIRPIIPLILLIYIFIKEKKSRLYIILSGIAFSLYGLIHLIVYKSFYSPLSYGSVVGEVQYIINYIYMIYLLVIIVYMNKKIGLPKLDKYLLIMLLEYMAIIYFSIITKTSYPTYVEGIGYRSYFTSGNAIGTILVLLYSSVLFNIVKQKSKLGFVLIILLAIYLMFLIGTRTGLIGFILITGIYIVLELLFNYKKILKSKIFYYSIPIIIILIIGVFLFGSKTLERRKLIQEEAASLIDINTNKVGHTTGDVSNYYYQIKNNVLDENLMTKSEKQSYIDLYEYANKKKYLANNTRKQQLIYNIFLVKNQKSIKGILFGNGYLNNHGEQILEMEIPAIILNFGIIGAILFLLPYIYLIVLFIKNVINKKQQLDKENLMNLMSIMLALTLSCLAGYVLFSSTCVLLIAVNIAKLKEE